MASPLSVKRHNQTIYDQMQPGDVLEFKRGWYNHYGVVVENKEIVHLSGDGDGISGRLDSANSSRAMMSSAPSKRSNKAEVRLGLFWDIAGSDIVEINNSGDRKHRPLSRTKIVKNAMSKIGDKGYNLLWKNCEHFANWCRYKIEYSEQVETALSVGARVLRVDAVTRGAIAFAASKLNETTTVSDDDYDDEK